MQAIITTFHGSTNTRGSRYSAKCEWMTIYLSADHSLNADENHKRACDELCARMDAQNVAKYGSQEAIWSKPKASGQLPSGQFAHVFLA